MGPALVLALYRVSLLAFHASTSPRPRPEKPACPMRAPPMVSFSSKKAVDFLWLATKPFHPLRGPPAKFISRRSPPHTLPLTLGFRGDANERADGQGYAKTLFFFPQLFSFFGFCSILSFLSFRLYLASLQVCLLHFFPPNPRFQRSCFRPSSIPSLSPLVPQSTAPLALVREGSLFLEFCPRMNPRSDFLALLSVPQALSLISFFPLKPYPSMSLSSLGTSSSHPSLRADPHSKEHRGGSMTAPGLL